MKMKWDRITAMILAAVLTVSSAGEALGAFPGGGARPAVSYEVKAEPGMIPVKTKQPTQSKPKLTTGWEKAGAKIQPEKIETGKAETTLGTKEPENTKAEETKTEETKSEETKPEGTISGETRPGETVPGDTKPGGTVSGDTRPGETVPGETKPGETIQGETKAEETAPGETKPGETGPQETEPGTTDTETEESPPHESGTAQPEIPEATPSEATGSEAEKELPAVLPSTSSNATPADADTVEEPEELSPLEHAWKQIIISANEFFSTLFGAEPEEQNELTAIAGSIEKVLWETVIRLAQEEETEVSGTEDIDGAENTDGAEDATASEAAAIRGLRSNVLAVPQPRTEDINNSSSILLTTGEYYIEDVEEYKAAPGEAAITIRGTVTLHVNGKLIARGGDAGVWYDPSKAECGAGAGINVPPGSILILDGTGSLDIQGGRGGNGGNGGDGGYGKSGWSYSTAPGGAGGKGGGGAGAGIGGNGGDGGDSGGGAGQAGQGCGAIYILGDFQSVNISGGADGGIGGKGGNGGDGVGDGFVFYVLTVAGGGGGGGGGSGYSAAAIGGGGSGGSGGKNGETGEKIELIGYTDSQGGDGGAGGQGSIYGGGGGGGGAAKYEAAFATIGFGGSGGNANQAGGSGGSVGADAAGAFDPAVGGEGGRSRWSSDWNGASSQPGGKHGDVFWLTSAFPIARYIGNGQPNIANGDYTKIYDLSQPDKTKVTVNGGPFHYDGAEKTPSASVTWGGETIDPSWYNMTYKDNIEVGTAQAIVTGKWRRNNPTDISSRAADSASTGFEIQKTAIRPSIAAESPVDFGNTFIATVEGNTGNGGVTGWKFLQGSGTITAGTDGVARIKPDKAGTVKLQAQVAATRNYQGATAVSLEITVEGKSLSDATIAVIPQQTYTSEAIRPKPAVYSGGSRLTEGTDFEYFYENNINTGTATVRVQGKGNYSSGKSAGFQIVPKDIGGSEVTLQAVPVQDYDGTAKEPVPVLSYRGNPLVSPRDFTYEHHSNVDVGTDTATVLIRGTGNFTGIRQARFTIQPGSIAQPAVKVAAITPVIFTGLKQEPMPVLTFESGAGTSLPLVRESDYTLSYQNHIEAGTATVTINGKGNFKDSRQITFEIKPKKLEARIENKFLEYGATADPAFTYTVTGDVKSYPPEFAGSMVRENPGNFASGVYRIYPKPGDELRLSDSGIYNKNYELETAEGYLSIASYTNFSEEAYLAIMSGGALTASGPDGDMDGSERWYRSQVYICAPAGFKISTSNSLAADNVWKESISYPDGNYITTGVTYFLKKDTGGISQPKYVYYKQDTQKPSGNAVIGDRAWSGYSTGTIPYEFFYKDRTEVVIFGSDELSGVPEQNGDGVTKTGIGYLITEEELTEAQLAAKPDSQWTYDSSLSWDTPKGILYVSLRDRAGNISYLHTPGLMFDQEPPEWNFTGITGNSGWVNSEDPEFRGTVADRLSGLKDRYVSYQLGTDPGDGSEISFGNPFLIEVGSDGSFSLKLESLSDGKYKVRLSASDKAGNTSIMDFDVKKDTILPEIEEITVDRGPGWVNQDVTVTPKMKDGLSGIKELDYSLDNGLTWKTTTSDSFVVSREGKNNQIIMKARDNAGNEASSRAGQVEVWLDKTSPQPPGINVGGSYYSEASGELWYGGNEKPRIVLKVPAAGAEEAPVSLRWKLYRQGETPPVYWEADTQPQIGGEGIWTLEYLAVDEAGNQSSIETETIRWDSVKPSFGSPAWTIEERNGGALATAVNSLTFGIFFNKELRIRVNAEDDAAGSGLQELSYSINGGTAKSISITDKYFDLPYGTNGTLSIKAVDKAGNTSGVLVINSDGGGNLVVENTPPILTVTQDSLPNANGWFQKEVKLTVQAEDADSGLAVVKGTFGENGKINRVLNNLGLQKSEMFQLIISEEGRQMVYSLEAVDNAGMTVTKNLAAADGYNIDGTAPNGTITASITPVAPATSSNYVGNWTNQLVTLTIDAADALSGVDSYSLTLDGGVTWETPVPWTAGSTSVTRPVPDGSHRIRLKIWDKAGNSFETKEDLIVRQDTSAPPEVKCTVLPGARGSYNSDSGWYNGPDEPVITLELPQSASNNSTSQATWAMYGYNPEDGTVTSDPLKWNIVDRVTVPRDDWGSMDTDSSGTETPAHGDPVEGSYELHYSSRNEAGADSAISKTVVKWDGTAPAFSNFVFRKEDGTLLDGLKNFLSYGNYYTNAVKVEMEVKDPTGNDTTNHVSGVDKVTFSINGKNPAPAVKLSEGHYSFLIPAGTVGKISVQAADIAGNLSASHVLGSEGSDEWALESALPHIGEITVTNPQLASADGARAGGDLWYTEDLDLSTIVIDMGSGLKTVTYTVSGNEQGSVDVGLDSYLSTFDWTDKMDSEGGPVTVKLTAADNAGNKAEREAQFYVDKQAPTATMSVAAVYNPGTGSGRAAGSTAADSPGWAKDATVQIAAGDTVSGLSTYSYTSDGGGTWTEPEPCSADASQNRFTVADGDYPEGEIGIRVVDVAGNCYDSLAKGDYIALKVDRISPPKAELTITPYGDLTKAYGPDGDGWYNGGQAPVLSFSVPQARADEAPNHVYWCIYGEGTPQPDPTADAAAWSKDGVPALPREGRFVLAWYTEDEAGNATDKAAPQTKVIRYDKTPPVYQTPAFAFTTVNGGPVSQLGNFLTFGNYFKEGIRANIYTDDDQSKTAEILYSFDMGATWKKAVKKTAGSGDPQFYFDLPRLSGGTLKIGIITIDAAGNAAPQIWLSGENGSSDWVFESQAPAILPITAQETMNADGWYHTPITLDITVQDEDSGLNQVTGSSAYSGGAPSELIRENWDGAAAIVTEKVYHPRLVDDGTGIEVTVTARDNGRNEASAAARFNIDTVKPVVSDIEGWPQHTTNVQPEVSFKVSDERSGIRESGIRILRDGNPVSFTYTATDGLSGSCSFKLEGNGLYTIEVSDTAGNPIETIIRDVDKIDTSGVAKLQVILAPKNPDGNEGWYLTCPSIEIVPMKQQGVVKLSTYYTLTQDGEAEPAPTLFLETNGAGTTGAESMEPVQPKIPSDGIWNLHVWVENSLGVSEHYRKEIKVDTHAPVDLYISGMPKDKAFSEAPEIWTNKDEKLYAHAKPVGTLLDQWSYTLDNGAHWSEWKEWSGDKSFKVKQDCADENMIRFRVRDIAGNMAESPSVTVLRDTEKPLLSIAEPYIGENGVPTDTAILLECSEPVWQLGSNHGSLRVYNAHTKSLWCEVKARDKAIDVNRANQTVEIRLPRALESGTDYYVTVSRDFVTDIAGNESMEGGAARNWTFTTAGSRSENGELYGFQVDLISGTPGTESTRRVMAVQSDSDQTRYSIAARPEYTDAEGTRKVFLEVLPLLTDPEGEVTLTADRQDVEVEELEDNVFEVVIPEGTDRTRLTAMTGGEGGERKAYVLTVIQGGFSADAAGALNPAIEELEVLNSISLEEEFADSRARKVNLRIQVSRTEENPEKAARYLLGEKLPADAKVQTLDIRMLKQRRAAGYQDDTETVPRLKNPVHITMDLEPEYRSYEHIAVMRLHDTQASFLKPDINQARTRMTIRTDRFSDYMVICSNEDLSQLLPKTEESVVRQATASEASPQEPQYELQKPGLLDLARRRKLPWWILLIALAAVIWETVRLYRERKKRKKEEASAADEDKEQTDLK